MSEWAMLSGSDEGFRSIYEQTMPSHANYARKWDLDYYGRQWEHSEFPASWAKVPAIKDLFYRGYHGVLWIDADAGFTQTGIETGGIEDKIKNSVVTLAGQWLEGIHFPCCGVMAVKNTDLGHQWLDELWDKRWQYQNHPWWEQAAAYEIMGYDNTVLGSVQGDPFRKATAWTPRINYLPVEWHSTPQDPHEPAYLYHATGYRDTAARIRFLQDNLVL
jgi:hypothetical protein